MDIEEKIRQILLPVFINGHYAMTANKSNPFMDETVKKLTQVAEESRKQAYEECRNDVFVETKPNKIIAKLTKKETT